MKAGVSKELKTRTRINTVNLNFDQLPEIIAPPSNSKPLIIILVNQRLVYNTLIPITINPIAINIRMLENGI